MRQVKNCFVFAVGVFAHIIVRWHLEWLVCGGNQQKQFTIHTWDGWSMESNANFQSPYTSTNKIPCIITIINRAFAFTVTGCFYGWCMCGACRQIFAASLCAFTLSPHIYFIPMHTISSYNELSPNANGGEFFCIRCIMYTLEFREAY